MQEKDVSAHGLRKFWEQHVHAKKESYVKQLNGRALNGVERAYDWLTVEQLFDIYKENYPNLECLSPSQMIKQEDIEKIVETRVQERTAYLTKQLAELNVRSARADQQVKEVLEFKDRLVEMENQLYLDRKLFEEEIMGLKEDMHVAELKDLKKGSQKPLAQMLKEKVEKAAKEMRQEFFSDGRIRRLIAEMAKSGELELIIKEEGEET